MSDELGRVRSLGAEALGEPGQRRFRLFVQGASGSAFIWLEKEQMNGLSIAIDRALAILSDGQVLRIEAQRGAPLQPLVRPADFPSTVEHDFQGGQLGLSFDEEDNLFVIQAMPVEVIDNGEGELVGILDDDKMVAFSFSLMQGQRLAQDITLIVASGRPVCPLCNQPLDGGPHACIKQNGHHKALLLEDHAESEDE